MMEVRGIDKTFLEENILEEIGSLDEAISRASVLQQDYVVRERTARGQFSNTQGKIEVCFTGFSKADGKYKGRKPTARNMGVEIHRLHTEGKKPSVIAKELNNGVASVYRYRDGCK